MICCGVAEASVVGVGDGTIFGVFVGEGLGVDVGLTVGEGCVVCVTVSVAVGDIGVGEGGIAFGCGFCGMDPIPQPDENTSKRGIMRRTRRFCISILH